MGNGDQTTDESRLPSWLEHYVPLPVWALVRSVRSGIIHWVNDQLAEDNERPRAWFVGQTVVAVWPDGHAGHDLDKQAVDEGRTLDTIVEGHDRTGIMRWFKAHRTPVDAELVLVVLDDITADLKLASMRLMLGKNLALESHTKLEQSFARQLLEGATLDELCERDDAKREEVRGKLALLVGEGVPQHAPWRSPPRRFDPEKAESIAVPEWIRCYDDLPIPTAVVTHASREVLWVNAVVGENNHEPREALVGRKLEQIWSGAADLPSMTHAAMAKGQTLESIHVGRNLTGDQSWALVRQIPLDHDQLLVCATDVTAKLRLHALRIILGLKPTDTAAPPVDDAFAQLLLKGASLPNICAALELSPQTVLGNVAAMMSG